MKPPAIVLLAAVIAITFTAVVPVSSDVPEVTSVLLELYEQQNDLMIELLFNEGCSFPPNRKIGRQFPNSNLIKLNVQRELFSLLATALLSCQGRQTIQTTLPVQSTTTTPTATTTPIPPPTECQSAINLTEYWRKDHSGSNIRPINDYPNCDIRDMLASGYPWFRFTGKISKMF